MKIILGIGIGSFIGGISRYLLTDLIQKHFSSTFPYGTMFVNIIGCFFIGIVYGWASTGNLSEEGRLFLTTGLIGGFTTFSAFSFEIITMLQNNELFYAILYLIISVLIGLLMTFLGILLMKLMM